MKDGQTGPLIRGISPEIRQVAQEMRREMTPAEQVLWCAIKSKRLAGLKFRAQQPVGRFILDFYCATRKLVIEVDGPVHDRTEEYDAARTAHLKAHGYRVIRFSNDEVLSELPKVLATIKELASLPMEEEAGQ